MALSRRIQKETERLQKDPVVGISAEPDPQNPRYFHISMAGPEGTPYQGGIFELELFLPDQYPMEPPKVRFLTKLYHPNVDKLGRICLDVLKNNWSPALMIRTVLLSIEALMGSANLDDPLDPVVARHWSENPDDAYRVAREWTVTYANGWFNKQI